MRSSFYVVGVAAAAIAGAGIVGFGCSSSSSPPANNTTPPADAATEAATCSALSDASVATGDFSPIWTCYEKASVCGAELTACAADCICNNAVLTSLECVALDAGTQQGCFESAPNGLGSVDMTDTAAGELGVCLLNVGSSCGATVVTDAGTDGSTDGGTKEDAASDAAITDAATGDAGDAAAP